MINTLKSTYPACHALVGSKFFSALCYGYIAVTPSTSPDLNDYGATFEQFLREFEPAQQLPYFPDVARLEWAWHQLLFAPRNYPADLSGLASLSEQELEALILQLPKDAVFVLSDYPLQAMWELCIGDAEQEDFVEVDSSTDTIEDLVEDSQDDEPEIDLGSGGVRLLLYRDQEGRQMVELSEGEYFLLHQFASGKTFGEASENFLKFASESDFTQAFARCCQQGWVHL